MRKKGLCKRVLASLLTLSMIIGTMPMTSFAAVPGTDTSSTDTNVEKVQAYAATMRDANVRTSYLEFSSDADKLTWDREGKTDSWRYYNGVMLDAFMMLGSDYYSYVKNFYDYGNIGANGEPVKYIPDELDSVPMGLALFDIIPNITKDSSDIYNGTVVSGYNVGSDVIAKVVDDTVTFNAPTVTTDGATSYVNGGNGVAVNNPFAGQDISNGAAISFWVTPQKNIAANDTGKTPVISFSNKSGYEFLKFDLEGTLKYRNYNKEDGTSSDDNIDYAGADAAMTKGQAYFVTVVINDSNFYYYVNGDLINYTTEYYDNKSALNDKMGRAKNMLTDSNTVMYIGGVDISDLISDGNEDVYVNDLAEGTVVSNVNTYLNALTQDQVTQLYNNAQVSRYETTIQYIYDQLEAQTSYSQCGGNFWHKEIAAGKESSWATWNIGLDGLYMAQPFLMECANAIDENKIVLYEADRKTPVKSSDIYGAVLERMHWIAENMIDEETGLYNHGWSVAQESGNGQFWSRGIGWYAVALVDIISMMPNAESVTTADGRTITAETLKADLKTLFDGMLQWQDANTGMWTNLVNRETALSGNELETSGSAMMAYALMKAYKSGSVTESKYAEAGLKAFNGVVLNKYDGTNVSGIYRSGSVSDSVNEYCDSSKYVSNEAKGIGVLIMASVYAHDVATTLNNSVSTDIIEALSDSSTNIVVTDSGASQLNVTDEASSVSGVVGTSLNSGYKAYGITLTNATAAATISIPVPSSIHKDTLVVYEVTADNTLKAVVGTVDENNNFVFKTTTSTGSWTGKYVLGTDGLEWETVGTSEIPFLSDYYETVSSMENGKAYILARGDNGRSCPLTWSSELKVAGGTNITQTATETSGIYALGNITDNNTWYFDGEHIYCKINGVEYYLIAPNNDKQVLELGEKTSASVWAFEAYTGTGGFDNNVVAMYTTTNISVNNNKLYVEAGSGGFGTKTGQKPITIWTRATETNTVTNEAAVSGKSTHVITVGTSKDSLIETIKANADVYYRESAESAPISVPWDDSSDAHEISVNVDSVETETVGTYEATILYGSQVIKTITVRVEDNLNWIDLSEVESEDYYRITTTMDASNTDGYLITARVNDENEIGDKLTLAWKLNDKDEPVYKDTSLIFTKDNAGRWKVLGLDDTFKWYYKDGHIYSNGDNGTTYYLQASNTDGLIGIKENDSDPAVWNFVERNSTSTFVRSINSNSEAVAIKSDGTKFNISGENNSVTIWEKIPQTTVNTGIAALGGQLVYDISGGGDSSLKQAIFESTVVCYKETADSEIKEISLTDSNVSWYWVTPVDNLTTGTYLMMIEYCGVELGVVAVNYKEPTWYGEEGEEIYELVTEMTSSNQNGYVITSTDNKIALGWDDAASAGQALTSVTINDIDGSSGNKVTITGLSDNNLWLYSPSKYIYSNGHYLSGKHVKVDGDDFVSIVLNEGDALTFTFAPDGMRTKITSSEDGVLKYDSRFLMGSLNNRLNLYEKTGEQTPSWSATLSGTTEYNVNLGDKSVTDVSIKEMANVLYQSGDEPYTQIIPWDSENVTAKWYDENDKEVVFSTANAGTYTLKVTYLKESIGEITVKVSDVSTITGEFSGTGTQFNTVVGKEPDFSSIKLNLTYKDSEGNQLGDVEEITVKNGLVITGYEIDTPETYTATVSYTDTLGKVYESNVTVYVGSDPYEFLEDATTLPEYPEVGAVGIDKFAENKGFTFRETGATKLELDVVGTAVQNGMDVVLVVDVSNSMGWSDDWFDKDGDQVEDEAFDFVGDGSADQNISEATESDKLPVKKDGSETAKQPTVDELTSLGYKVNEQVIRETILDSNMEDDKLDKAMQAASKFADVLLGGNEGVSNSNNSLTFVTFGGYDKDNIKTINSDNVDSVQTVFTNVQDANTAKDIFKNTKFSKYQINDSIIKEGTDENPVYKVRTGVTYTLQIGDSSVKGINRGNTNYDYAFAEAKKAVDSLHEQYSGRYDELGRQTVVIFMTDGAATHYNDERANGTADDRIYDYTIEYPAIGNYLNYIETEDNKNTADNWTKYLLQSNHYAEELDEKVDALYTIGFDFDHGGFSDFTWDAAELRPVLENLAGKDYAGNYNVDGVELAANSDQLADYLDVLSSKITKVATDGLVTDVIGDDFTLLRGTKIENLHLNGVDDGGDYATDAEGNIIPPNIEVIKYDVYTKADAASQTQIGARKLDENGDEIKEVLETVSFNEAGTEAYSSEDIVIGTQTIPAGTNIMTKYNAETGEITIEAKYFTYTKVRVTETDATTNETVYDYIETFEWRIGDITEDEVAFSYYVYLENAECQDENSPDGIHYTNDSAILEYVDLNNKHATQVFDPPKKNWGSAITTVELYLVNENGQLVNSSGLKIPQSFDNRIKVSLTEEQMEDLTRTIIWDDETFTYKVDISSFAPYVPQGYALYDPAASYSISVSEESANINEATGELSVTTGKDTKIGERFLTTRVDTNAVDDMSSTVIAVPVYMTVAKTVTTPLGKDQIVIDYGKAIDVNIFADNPRVNSGNFEINGEQHKYDARVIGVVPFDEASYDYYTQYVQKFEGYGTCEGTYGTFSIVETSDGIGSVRYEPNSMVEAVDKVFTVAEVIQDDNENEKYYLYQELDIIPATVMYYETDFVDGVFTTTQSEDGSAWSEKIDSGEEQNVVTPTETEDPVQNDGTIAVTPAPQTYGFDSTYNDDSLLSDGSSMFVKGGNAAQSAADAGTTASFTFTGTGFDLISRTGAEQGLIQAKIYNTLDNSLTKTISVLNKADSTWGELYQIPVISTEVAYGTYRVDIIVFSGYNNEKYPVLYRGNEFYFDAIRIYDPMGVGSTTDATALEAYIADGQAYPTVSEVREMLIKPDDFDVDISSTDGMLFIEKPVWNADTGKYELGTNDRVSISEYDTIGPNNETYLNSGDVIAFKLTGIDITTLASVDIGAKSVNGKTAVLKAAIAKPGTTTPNYQIDGQSIASSTQQYYDLLTGISDLSTVVENGEAYVFITNAGESGNILSITDIKIAYGKAATEQVQIESGVDVTTVYTSWLLYEPDYDIKSAEFTTENCKVFGKANLVVETTQDVETVKVTDSLGIPVSTQAAYEDLSDGTRVWVVTMTMMRLGEHTYTVTGYGADGSTGEGAEAKISVTYKEGGGWQDAKSIFKTLFYCRILSAKRSSSNKLFR